MDPERPNTTSTNVTEEFPSAPEDYFIKDLQMSPQSPVLSTQYLHSSGLICLGCKDGTTRILSTTKKAVQYSLVKDDKSPVMCIASTSPASIIKNTLMVAHTDGTLEYWHATSNQLLFQKKYPSSLQSCEISCNNQWYVVSGENGDMLLGHLDKGNPTELETGQLGAHSNRVFCIKWHPTDVNTFLSGGWDRAVFLWDVRTKTAVKTMYGYAIGGQAIDVRNTEVLLGNNMNENQLSIYDLKADKVHRIGWEHYDKASKNGVTGVNSCAFGKQEGDILALTTRNEVRFIRNDKCLSLFRHPDEDAKGHSMSLSPTDKVLIATWNTGDIKIMAY